MIVREYEEDEFAVHRVPLMMVGALILAVIALTTSVSFGLMERQAIPEQSRAAAGTMSTETRSIQFFDESDGTVRVEDAFSGQELASFGPGTGGFVRSSVRSLVHHRRINGIGRATPFELIEWEDGALTLRDTTTGETVELASFGADNRKVFADMLERGI
jgi:putative photosynthetic complex assembly protein